MLLMLLYTAFTADLTRCRSPSCLSKMSVRATSLLRRHPLVVFLLVLVLLSVAYLRQASSHGGGLSAGSSINSMAGFNFSDHFARLQHAHWHASSGYGEDPAQVSDSTTASSTRRILQPQEAFRVQDGLLYLADQARPGANPANKVEHPILFLIRQAKKDWKKKLDSQSRDLATAVKTYRKKYGRAPPQGFDKW